MLDVRRLRTLREVALRGSFSAAAQHLHYTQAAVSQQIARLEEDAGTLLVDRSVRPLQLTDAGAALVARIEAVLGELAAAEAELEALRSLEGGRLRVGFFSAAGLPLLAPAVGAFRARRPRVELTITEGSSSALTGLVRAGELDVAVVAMYPELGERIDPALASTRLRDDPFALVLPQEHRLARRAKVALADLRDDPFIVPAPDGPAAIAYTRQLDAACARAGFAPQVAFHITDCQTAQAFVADGHGIAIFPDLALHPLNAGVVKCALSDAPPPRELLAVHRPGILAAAGREFVDLLREPGGRAD